MTYIPIYNIILHPTRDLDLRLPYNKDFMLVCFDYVRPPETDDRIIRKIESEFKDDHVKNDYWEAMRIHRVRKQLEKSKTITTFFKEKISLS